MSDATDPGQRLRLVRRALELSPEPLHMPLGFVFRPRSGEEHLRDWAEHAARAVQGTTFAPATLYVNIPFCARVCTYCLLSAVRMPGKDTVERYLTALKRQIALYEPAVRGLRFGSLHIGGGTPTLLDERQLHDLLTELRRLPLADDVQIGVEAHPATSTAGRLAVLRRHGVQRLSFGVESMTPLVLANVNRADQTEARVRSALAEARRQGFTVNVDLLAGLPGETAGSWDETVEKTLAMRPDSLSVNRFLGENSPLAVLGYGPDEADNRRVDGMLLRADRRIRSIAPPRWPEEPLARAGFGTQYVWDSSESARPYFQDDMIGPVSTLALGHGALGHVYGRHFSVPAGPLTDFLETLERGAPPAVLASNVDERFEMAFFVADRACRGDLTREGFARVFGGSLDDVFARDLAFLASRGLLQVEDGRVRKPPQRDFQVMHLLAFLVHDGRSLAGQVRALEDASLVTGAAGTTFDVVEGRAQLETLVAQAVAGDRVLRIDVGEGLDGDTATHLGELTQKHGLTVEVRGDPRRPLLEYAHVREELPPSLLWVRVAVRAAQASRGEQRLLAPRRSSGSVGTATTR